MRAKISGEQWHEEPDPSGHDVIIRDENGFFVCAVHANGGDAELIARAPRLECLRAYIVKRISEFEGECSDGMDSGDAGNLFNWIRDWCNDAGPEGLSNDD
jgi:hypothetical protein